MQSLGGIRILRINSQRHAEALRSAHRIARGGKMIARLHMLAHNLLPQHLAHGHKFHVAGHEFLGLKHCYERIFRLACSLEFLRTLEFFFGIFSVFVGNRRGCNGLRLICGHTGQAEKQRQNGEPGFHAGTIIVPSLGTILGRNIAAYYRSV